MRTNPILKRKINRRLKLESIDAVLADSAGVVFDNPISRPGYVRVRYTTAAGLSLPPVVRVGPSYYAPLTPGKAVKLRYDDTGELCVWEPNIAGQIAAGDNPIANIPNPTGNENVNTTAIVPLKSFPTSPPSLKVVVKSLLSRNGTTVSLFNGAQIDLTSYIPSAGNQRLAGIFLKSDGTLEVSASTTQTLPEPLDLTDVQECLTGASAGSASVWIWWLHDAQTTITDADSWIDFREYLNVPALTTETIYQAKVLTTDATVTTLYTFTIPASTTYAISAKVVARRTGGASGTAEDGAYYVREAAIKNAAGTATLIGSVASIATMEDQGSWDATIDVTGATARVRVTGAVNNNISWVLTAKVYQVSS